MPTIPSQNLIHQPNELAASTGFRLFSEQGMTPNLPPLRIMNYAFGLILTGTATEIIGLQTYPVKPYSVVFTFPGQIISYGDPSPDLSFLYCVLDEDFMTNPHLNRTLLNSFGFFRTEGRPVFDVPVPTGQLIHGLLKNIQTEYEDRSLDYEVMIRLYVHEILILINRAYAPEGTHGPLLNRGQVISRDFKELVSQHYLTKKQVRAYADLLSITPRHLSEMIKTHTGLPPSHWVLTMEMLEAKFQLTYSTRTIAEIADYLGYRDPAYFGKVFKKHTGLSPQQYRES